MKNYEDLEKRVILWAKNKGILTHGTPQAQAIKTLEEAKEIQDAILTNNSNEIIDALGDTLVTIIIQAKMNDLNLLECLEVALNVIEKRNGKMINGSFVKDK